MADYNYLLAGRPVQVPDPLERATRRMSLARMDEEMRSSQMRRQQVAQSMADLAAFRAELGTVDLSTPEGEARLLRSSMARGPQYVEAAAKVIAEQRRARQERSMMDELERRLRPPAPPHAPMPDAGPSVATPPQPTMRAPEPLFPPGPNPAVSTEAVPPPVFTDSRGPIAAAPTQEPRPGQYLMKEPLPTTPPAQGPYGPQERMEPAPVPTPQPAASTSLAPRDLATMAPAERYLALRREHARRRALALQAQGKFADALRVLDDSEGPLAMKSGEAIYAPGIGWVRPDAAPAAPDEFTRRATDAGVQPGSQEYQQLARRRLDEMVRGQRATDSEFFQAMKAAGIVEGSPEWQSMSRQRAQRLMRAPGGGSGGGEATIPGSFTAVGVTPDGKQVVFNNKTARNYIVGPSGPVPYDGAFTPKAAHERDVADVGKLRQNVLMGDRLMAIVSQTPQAFSGYMGAISHLPSGIAARMPGITQEIIDTRTAVLRDAAMTISEIYGAALSMGEQYRANTFIPAPDDTPEVVLAKLKSAIEWARSKMEGYSQSTQDAAGVRRPGATQPAPAAPAGSPPMESFFRR